MWFQEIIQRYTQYGFRKTLYFLFSELRIRVINPICFHSYSQFGEDLWLNTYFKGKTKGFYLDIGAYDPFRFSNTMHFYKKGWRGISVEPNSERFRLFPVHRPEDINLNMGIGVKNGKMIFYRIDPPTLSTFSKFQAEVYVKQGFRITGKVQVNVFPLKELCSLYVKKRIIDFMSIDVEGTELEVLKSNDWKRFRPRIICIESTVVSEKQGNPRDKKMQKFFRSHGYRCIHQTEANSFYEDKKDK